MAAARPSREDVLAWMQKTESGAKAAAKRFDLPLPTVKTWVRRARLKRGASPESPTGAGGQGTQGRSNLPSGAGTSPPTGSSAPETASLALDEIATGLAEAARVRARNLSEVSSIGKGEKDTAIALGIIVDKLKIIREMHVEHRQGSGAAGSEDAARRILRALGGSGSDDSG